MHKPILTRLASDNNSRHFRDLGAAFRAANPPINISAVGGQEFDGTGVFAFLIDDDTDDRIEQARAIAERLNFGFDVIASKTIKLKNEPGQLGEVGDTLDNAGVNVLSLLFVGMHGGRALLNVGVHPDQLAAADQALAGYSILADDVLGHEA